PRVGLGVAQPVPCPCPLSAGIVDCPLRLISVGAVVPRKGFDVLVEALAPLARLRWHLVMVGDRQRDTAAAARLDSLIARHGLERRIDCLGTVSADRLAQLYGGADLFVLASHFEGYGMAFAEALAHGLPIVGTTGGATPQIVPAAAGRLVAPGDISALSNALRELIEDKDRRRALGAAARAAALSLPSWSAAGETFSGLLSCLT